MMHRIASAAGAGPRTVGGGEAEKRQDGKGDPTNDHKRQVGWLHAFRPL